MPKRVGNQLVLSFKLTTAETFILGAALAAAEGVNLSHALSLSATTHAAITIFIVVLGAVVQPITSVEFLAKIPAQIKAIVQGLLGAILIAQQSWHVSVVVTVIIGVILVIANTLGLGPSPEPVPPAAAK